MEICPLLEADCLRLEVRHDCLVHFVEFLLALSRLDGVLFLLKLITVASDGADALGKASR